MWSLVIGLVMLQGKQHVESRDGTGHVAGRKSMRRFEKIRSWSCCRGVAAYGVL